MSDVERLLAEATRPHDAKHPATRHGPALDAACNDARRRYGDTLARLREKVPASEPQSNAASIPIGEHLRPDTTARLLAWIDRRIADIEAELGDSETMQSRGIHGTAVLHERRDTLKFMRAQIEQDTL